jgi:hypothetical protein
MSVFLQPIYTQTVGSGGVTSITFNNIPQTFTDLKIVMSLRGTANGDTVYYDDFPRMRFNGDTATNYSRLSIIGDGGANAVSTQGYANENYAYFGNTSGSTATANTFGSAESYIPNYTSSNFKQMISDTVAESNNAIARIFSSANLWRSTAAITSINISLTQTSSNIAQYSTISLYGITKG